MYPETKKGTHLKVDTAVYELGPAHQPRNPVLDILLLPCETVVSRDKEAGFTNQGIEHPSLAVQNLRTWLEKER
jgi:hypothetical protein